MRFLPFFACLLTIAGFSPLVHAHQVPSVELEFQNTGEQWRLLGEMDIAYMLPETRTNPDGLPLDRDVVMAAPPEELERIRKETESTLRMLLRLTFAGEELPWRIEFPDFEKDPFALPEEAGNFAMISTRLVIDPVSYPGDLRIHWAGEQDTELIILIDEGDDARIVSTLPGGSLMLLNQAESAKSLPVESPWTGGWLQSGFYHVLPLGLDHMLFMLGLFLLVPKWKPLLGQSLLFTFAHSITLALAVFGWVSLPQQLVEVLIAASIAWIGVGNLLTRKLGKQRLFLVFGFGLLHGLGFASVLADKLSGVSRDKLAGPLLGFNVGVELAQVTVLCAAFLILWPLRKWTLQVQIAGSALVALAGLAWMIERIFFFS
ncbi:MAG: HupE/UreJ family protein [Akkermansiaceae bacterium]